jgi:hypothetical protein
MSRPPGLPKTGGRQKGTGNRSLQPIRDMLRAALDGVGGAEYLKTQAIENPTAFMGLIGRLVPAEVSAKIAGADGGPVRVEVLRVRDAPGTMPVPQDEPAE